MWTKLMSSSSSKSTLGKFSAGERHQEEISMAAIRRPNKARSSLNIEEEYSRALRTKSYIDLYSKARHHLSRSSSTSVITPRDKTQDHEEEEEAQGLQHAHSSPSPSSYGDPINDFFHLEPSQETLLASTSRKRSARSAGRFHLHLNELLFDFFDVTSQACTACASLLSSIDRARYHHRFIHHLLAKLPTASDHPQFSTFPRLISHLEIDNPLSPQNLSHFHHIHSLYPTLIRRLASARLKVARRIKLIKLTKKASGVAVVAILGVAVAAALVIATHGTVVVAAAPLATAAGGVRGMGRWVKGWVRLERTKVRVDAASKGAYIVGRDLDTMSQMVRRVHDEVEHGRDVARMVVRNRECEMVKEVVKEMEGRGGEVGLGFEEHLEELEEHIYLCMITINRSRRLVAQDMLELQQATEMA